MTKELAPRGGFEPPTFRLTAECSTVELPGIRTTHLFSFIFILLHQTNSRHDLSVASRMLSSVELAPKLPCFLIVTQGFEAPERGHWGHDSSTLQPD
jgi:hypothetical protein